MTKDDVIDIIKDAGYGVLATAEGNQPRVRPMSPFLTEDGKLLLALFAHVRTVEQIKENPMVEICFVDRKMQFCRIAGSAEIDNGPESKEILWNNVPPLKQYFNGPEDPNFLAAVIKIEHVEAMSPQDQQPNVIIFN